MSTWYPLNISLLQFKYFKRVNLPEKEIYNENSRSF